VAPDTGDRLTGLNIPFIEPDFCPGQLQLDAEPARVLLILVVVRQEDVDATLDVRIAE
jgi:hypothetical protein